MALNPKQAAFVREYLRSGNATESAKAAGYSAKTAYAQGSRLLKGVEVQQALVEKQAKVEERAEVDKAYVLRNLTEVVERCMQRAPVMERVEGEMVQVVDEDGRHVWEFNANGANKALELLGKHLKMFTEKTEVTGADGGPLSIRVVSYGADEGDDG